MQYTFTWSYSEDESVEVSGAIICIGAGVFRGHLPASNEDNQVMYDKDFRPSVNMYALITDYKMMNVY